MAVDPAIPCNHCPRCLEGNPNLCPSVRSAGTHGVDGALTEYMTWPARNLIPISDRLSDAEGTLLEPLGVALNAIDLGMPPVGSSVGVYGCGPIGLLVVQLARLAGASRPLQAQSTGRLTGIVTNEQGQPVASASVVLKGTRIGTLTGADGRYLMPGIPSGSQTVVATLLGYGDATREVSVVAGQTTMANFQLIVKAVQLEGIVAVGYGTQTAGSFFSAAPLRPSVVAALKAQHRAVPNPVPISANLRA